VAQKRIHSFGPEAAPRGPTLSVSTGPLHTSRVSDRNARVRLDGVVYMMIAPDAIEANTRIL
jgi:hypothetical protein